MANKKTTTIKIQHKDLQMFQALAPLDGITVLGGNIVGDIAIPEVRYRDPAYLFYLGCNFREAVLKNSVSTAITTSSSAKATDGNGNTSTPEKKKSDGQQKTKK